MTKKFKQTTMQYFFEAQEQTSTDEGTLCLSGSEKHPLHRIIWISEGSAGCFIDFESHRLASNSVCTIPPGRIQRFEPAHGCKGYVLSFDNDFYRLAADGPGRPSFTGLPGILNQVSLLSLPRESPEMLHIFQELVKESGGHAQFKLEILIGLFNLLLVHLNRQATNLLMEMTTSTKVNLFDNFASQLDKQFMKKKQVAEYASELCVSPRYLTAVVKKVSGFSPSYHIQQRLVQEAKRMALASDANMKAVAYMLGFEDLSHFSKFFKQAAGVSFSEFKKRIFIRQAGMIH